MLFTLSRGGGGRSTTEYIRINQETYMRDSIVDEPVDGDLDGHNRKVR